MRASVCRRCSRTTSRRADHRRHGIAILLPGNRHILAVWHVWAIIVCFLIIVNQGKSGDESSAGGDAKGVGNPLLTALVGGAGGVSR